jgi:hypothetical protein
VTGVARGTSTLPAAAAPLRGFAVRAALALAFFFIVFP